MDNELLWPVLTFVGGALGRILIPYLLEWVNKKSKFDWRYIVGQVLAVVIALVPVVFNDSWVEELSKVSSVTAVSMGWFAADIGRQVQKTYSLVRGK